MDQCQKGKVNIKNMKIAGGYIIFNEEQYIY